MNPQKFNFPDVNYFIDVSGELSFDPQWLVSNGDPAGCELSYSFSPSSYSNVFSIEDDSGILLMETGDTSLSGEAFTVTFSAEVVESGETGSITFEVTF